MNKENLKKRFEELFGKGGDIRIYFAPGRVNLIGEHTDYNGGCVLPCALDIGTYAVARLRRDSRLRMYSLNFEHTGIMESSLGHLEYSPKADWTNYPKGIIWTYQEHHLSPRSGMDLLFYGTIPNGSGLSSSSSIDIVTGFALKDLFGYDISDQMQAKLGQYAENHYNHVNCGIMDQFSIVMGKANHVIFLNTTTLSYRYAPLLSEEQTIVIANTNKKRQLADSKYNERRSECEEALIRIQKAMSRQGMQPVDALCKLTNDSLSFCSKILSDDLLFKRVRHAITEQHRTAEAVNALENGNMVQLGRLMQKSHISLRDDYEVTGAELDALVNAAIKIPGTLGSRMTGAGFGGCTVNLVKKSDISEFMEKTGAEYHSVTGLYADFYVVTPGDGVRRIE